MKLKLLFAILTTTFTWLTSTCSKHMTDVGRKLTLEWHKEEETKIDKAVVELRRLGRWDEKWDKFSKLADYSWRKDMDCGGGYLFDDGKVHPCVSGGYTFSQAAFDQLKHGDLNHDAHNTVEEGALMFQALHSNQLKIRHNETTQTQKP